MSTMATPKKELRVETARHHGPSLSDTGSLKGGDLSLMSPVPTPSGSKRSHQEEEPFTPMSPLTPIIKYHRNRRANIFARAASFHELWKPIVIEKSDSERKQIRDVLKQNILFNTLPEETLDILIKAMFKSKYKKDDVIIKQGDEGDHFYVLSKGLVEIYKHEDKDREDQLRALEEDNKTELNQKSPEELVAHHEKRKFTFGASGKASANGSVSPQEGKSGQSSTTTASTKSTVEAKNATSTSGSSSPPSTTSDSSSTSAVPTHPKYGGLVQVCNVGQTFGELALMYGHRRAATAIAKEETEIWTVDRGTFHRTLRHVFEKIKIAESQAASS